jgi:putative transposase
MPSTHCSIHLHITFATSDRKPWIHPTWRDELHNYMGGIANARGAQSIQIGGVDDHAHLLLSLKPTLRVADVVREIKKGSCAWATRYERRFGWQEGYGAFSVSREHIPRIAAYVRQQEEHHRHVTFQEEYVRWLQEEGIAYDARYLW